MIIPADEYAALRTVVAGMVEALDDALLNYGLCTVDAL